MRNALELCARFAIAPWPVLLLGEPGTGKSLLAEYIHRLSARTGEFIKRSFGSHTQELEYDTLAGHAVGSFTGAGHERKGLVEAAHQGTLFLDEVALAPLSVQEMLLELLDEGHLRRLGENRYRPVNVRLIFATNADLALAAQEHRFRNDLFGRMGQLRIVLPPLRERKDEIIPLARHYVKVHAQIFPGYHPILTPEAEELLELVDWPENIRGLVTSMQYAVLMAHPSTHITLDHLPPALTSSTGSRRDHRIAGGGVSAVLNNADGNKSEAARRLGISRSHLYALIRKEGLERSSNVV